jgi:class 3 adenylate cyclase/predicted ATPase
MDIGAWLRGLNLEQYAGAFRENDIDSEVLPDLTADDLIAIGVTSVGHRRKLLAALAALRPEPARGGSVEQASTASSARSHLLTGAERRHLTVLFCDLVGSTALTARHDPEDAREVLGTYHAAVSNEVARLDGFVAKFMGDGVLAYFGYPTAHEDDAERAIRTALALTERIGSLKSTSGVLAVRVGIATGLVVVGDMIGSGESQERGIVGETPNLAARLQTLAEPGTVLIAGATRQLVGDLFEFRDLGSVEIKGFDNPVVVWQVLRPSAIESRFEALHASGLTPLVGREEEVDMLFRRWQRASTGQGQIVLISGEPGIGKSRLTAALQEGLSNDSAIAVRYFCSPHHRDSSLHPFISQITRAANFDRDDLSEVRLDKLEAMFGPPDANRAEKMAVLAELLGIPTEGRYPSCPPDPQRKRDLILEALAENVVVSSRERPLIMLFEDAHWADSTSLELLDRLVERAKKLPVMLVITFRPEFTPPWTGQANVTSIALTRLPRPEITAIVNGITGGKTLPVEIFERIAERTDGIPLFVEELTKAVLEGGQLREEEDRYTLTGPLGSFAIPSSLQASLLARLDRLQPVKEVAQIGAALGREFSYEMLAAVYRHGEPELGNALTQLTEAGLVFCRGSPPHATYLFKHALVQDTAYGTLLRSQRQELHARILSMMEDRFPELATSQPEIMAYHSSEAGYEEKAASYFFKAGHNSASRSANAEASGHLTRGLENLARLPDTLGRLRQELAFQLALGPVLMSLSGYHAPGVHRAYQRAKELAEQLGDDRARFAALWGLWLSGTGRRDELLEDMFRVAKDLNDNGLLLQAHHSAWATLIWRGELGPCRDHVRRGLALYDRKRHGDHALLYGGHDPGVCGKGQGGMLLWLLGHPDQAAQNAQEGMALARDLEHSPSLAHAYWFAGCIHLLRRDVPAVLDCGEYLLRLGAEHRLGFYRSIGGIFQGWSFVQLGRVAEGLAEMRPALDTYGATGPTMIRFLHAILAESELSAGNHEKAAAALNNPRLSGLIEVFWKAGILCIEAGILLAKSRDDRVNAEQRYVEALALARQQTAKSLELRVAMSLARFWSEEGKRVEAHDVLAPVYEWFKEGLDTPDLMDARALLEKL